MAQPTPLTTLLRNAGATHGQRFQGEFIDPAAGVVVGDNQIICRIEVVAQLNRNGPSLTNLSTDIYDVIQITNADLAVNNVITVPQNAQNSRKKNHWINAQGNETPFPLGTFFRIVPMPHQQAAAIPQQDNNALLENNRLLQQQMQQQQQAMQQQQQAMQQQQQQFDQLLQQHQQNNNNRAQNNNNRAQNNNNRAQNNNNRAQNNNNGAQNNNNQDGAGGDDGEDEEEEGDDEDFVEDDQDEEDQQEVPPEAPVPQRNRWENPYLDQFKDFEQMMKSFQLFPDFTPDLCDFMKSWFIIRETQDGQRIVVLANSVQATTSAMFQAKFLFYPCLWATLTETQFAALLNTFFCTGQHDNRNQEAANKNGAIMAVRNHIAAYPLTEESLGDIDAWVAVKPHIITARTAVADAWQHFLKWPMAAAKFDTGIKEFLPPTYKTAISALKTAADNTKMAEQLAASAAQVATQRAANAIRGGFGGGRGGGNNNFGSGNRGGFGGGRGGGRGGAGAGTGAGTGAGAGRGGRGGRGRGTG
jgi:hypothetical protein